MIKRILSLVLCLCLLGTATVALAEETTTDGTVQYPTEQTGNFGTPYGVDITVIAQDSDKTQVNDAYSVKIVWGDMAFAWGKEYAEVLAWDPESHQYVTTAGGNSETEVEEGWYMVTTTAIDDDGAEALGLTTQDCVMVFNHSSLPVDVAFTIDNSNDGTNGNVTADLNVTHNSDALNEGKYQLKYAGVGDEYACDDDSSVGGKIVLSASDTSTISTSETTVATLKVTISKGTGYPNENSYSSISSGN